MPPLAACQSRLLLLGTSTSHYRSVLQALQSDLPHAVLAATAAPIPTPSHTTSTLPPASTPLLGNADGAVASPGGSGAHAGGALAAAPTSQTYGLPLGLGPFQRLSAVLQWLLVSGQHVWECPMQKELP